LTGAVAVLAVLGVVGAAVAGGGGRDISEELTGYEEAPLVISTTGRGTFDARYDRHSDEAIGYTLSYSDLEGAVQQAHIHLGAESVTGGISVFLCSNLGNGPAGTQPCPPPPATITGEIGPEDVIGPLNQGIEVGAFDELLAAIDAGATYVNVHSTKWPSGEIRAQIDARGSQGD
jgi:CHRD domain